MRGAACPLGRLLVLLSVVLTASAAPFCWGDQEKIFLRDIRSLTLYPNEPTNSRRSNVQIPQLQCVGGAAGCSANTPEFAICYNRGWDGADVQWECKLELDNSYRIGRAVLNCEGYDYPEDPYVLKGSCGLQYTLEFAKENQTTFDGYDSLTSSFGILCIILFGALAYGFFKISCNCDLPPSHQRLRFPADEVLIQNQVLILAIIGLVMSLLSTSLPALNRRHGLLYKTEERAARPSLDSSEDPGFWSRMIHGWVPENLFNSWRSPPDYQCPSDYQSPPDYQRSSNYQRPPDNQRHFFSPVAPQSALTSASSFPIESRKTFPTPPEKLPITSKMQGNEEEDNISMATTSE